ncbi:MAG: alanyl-tRNA synthetase [Planctomycetota bacterium]|jgi:alanyl-tRNA synthetase
MKTSQQIRQEFLDYFSGQGHRQVPSSPVFPMDDPTLLFTNAGMNQFKDVFLGTGTRDYTRATDTQKCIRVSGKHNDLEEVGVDTYHHTFFEMLGNWSFGDYFKEESIVWAWELLTKVWGLPKDRLWVTVFGGDKEDGLSLDSDADRIWKERTDIDPTHILPFGKGDNFWEMGETGPCGPCSEIHFDRGPEGSNPTDGADLKLGVNAGNERFIEIWNLVFMEFNRLDDGSLKPLPNKHVDTGMGFERIVAVIQGKSSNYDTDVFQPIFRRLEELTGKTYGKEEEVDIAFRVIADHVRASTAAFADGALPSNVGRGYVLRRLIRRASRYGRQVLGMDEPFIFEVTSTVAEILGDTFPEMAARVEHVRTLIRSEEVAFGKTLGRGLVRFEELAKKVVTGGSKVLPGSEAFELYATSGFPRDLVELMARERSLEVDEDGWNAAQKKHQDASRSEGSFKQLLSAEQLDGLKETLSTYHDSNTSCALQVLGLFPGGEGMDALVLDRSPFYAESGGQVGDTGTLQSSDGTFRFQVKDTQRLAGIVVHVGHIEGSIETGANVEAAIDMERRTNTIRNHTATHLLHRALRAVLGDHVTQQGSYVGPDRLRFDFSQPKGMTPAEIESVEGIVNAQVCANASVVSTVEDLDAAKERGVMALFGEKYADRVRVVDVGGWSVELCGGTHVSAAGEIGPVVIVSEGAIQAGVRRIEALTGSIAIQWMQDQRRILGDAAHTLKSKTTEVPARIEELQLKVKQARKQAQQSAMADVDGCFEKVKQALTESEGILVGAANVGLPQAGVRELANRLKSLGPDLAVVLLGQDGPKVPWIAVVQGQARERGWDAGKAAGFLRQHLGGGGGGKPDLAQGQGQKAQGVPAILEQAKTDPAAIFGG